MVKEIKEDGRLTIDQLVDLNIMRLKENIVRLKQTLAKHTQGQYVYMKQVFMYIVKMKNPKRY